MRQESPRAATAEGDDVPTRTPPGNDRRSPLSPARLARAAVGGVLMGIANLIPGVSGGTMILAMGLYEEFIDSVAELTALRFSVRRILFLAVVGAFAGAAIVGLAGVILYLLFHYTSAMFALFIGLTLGGAPLLARSLRPVRADVVVATVVGFGLMVGVFALRGSQGLPHNTAMDFVSGVVGSTTMVLPGISGSYMLLVMDQYERVVGAVRDLREAARARDGSAVRAALWILVPVGFGAVLGIVALSNALKFLLRRYHRVTIGVLLGILLGSVLGLYPFGRAPGAKALERQSPAELRQFAQRWDVEIAPGTTDGELAAVILKGWPQRRAPTYSAGAVGTVVVLVPAGFAVTSLLARKKPA